MCEFEWNVCSDFNIFSGEMVDTKEEKEKKINSHELAISFSC